MENDSPICSTSRGLWERAVGIVKRMMATYLDTPHSDEKWATLAKVIESVTAFFF